MTFDLQAGLQQSSCLGCMFGSAWFDFSCRAETGLSQSGSFTTSALPIGGSLRSSIGCQERVTLTPKVMITGFLCALSSDDLWESVHFRMYSSSHAHWTERVFSQMLEFEPLQVSAVRLSSWWASELVLTAAQDWCLFHTLFHRNKQKV